MNFAQLDLHCGLKNIKSACKYTAIGDVLVGCLTCMFVGAILSELYKDEVGPKAEARKTIRVNRTPEETLHLWRVFTWIFFSASAVQFVMGAVLLLAVHKNITLLCRLWQFTSCFIGCFTLPFIYRFVMIGWVDEFCKAVREGTLPEEEPEISQNTNRQNIYSQIPGIATSATQISTISSTTV